MAQKSGVIGQPLPMKQGERTYQATDARGRRVTQLDPVAMHVLNYSGTIPVDKLSEIADEIRPKAKRQGLFQALTVLFGLLFVIGGNVFYFSYFSTWKGLDPIGVTIYVIQFVVIVSGPLIAYRLARGSYANRITPVMLKYSLCPHCGYDLRLLPASPNDGATTCPECGCAWLIDDTELVSATGALTAGTQTQKKWLIIIALLLGLLALAGLLALKMMR